jgi:Cof subfamily protein (haloacid dehalogenase superfamily)
MTEPHPTGIPRVVASDLDGTLLRSDGSVSDRTREALRRTEDAEIEVVFVTARPPRWIAPVADAVAGHGVVIAGNGAFVVDARTLEVTQERGFSRTALLEVLALLRREVPDAGFAVERSNGMTTERGYRSLHGIQVDATELDRLEDIDEVPTGKLLVVGPDGAGEEFQAAVQRAVGELGHVSHSGVGRLAEISAPGVTKAAGLARWCAERGIRAEHVWAFGDMPNDLPMLRWAGSSFAVANAHAEVRATAGHTVPSNDEDGVAVALEALLGRCATRP